MLFLLIYLSFTLFSPLRATDGNKWLPSPLLSPQCGLTVQQMVV